MKYQLPCSCGKSIPIEVSQAGQMVHCSCGAQLEIPTMRLIRQLQPVEAEAPEVRPVRATRWSVASRVLFVWGLAISALGLSLAAYYQWGRSSLHTQEEAWDRTLDSDVDRLSNMDLDEAWRNWELVRDSGIGPYSPPRYIVSRIVASVWKKYVLTGLGIALAGFVVIIVAALLPRQRVPALGKPARL